MRWEKIGRIFCPDNQYHWMMSHAANPVAKHLRDDYFKIYFNTRDEHNRSSICWLIIDIKNPLEVLELGNKPLLERGEDGLFDDSGVSLGCIIENEAQSYLYYIGWNLGVTVPWRNYIGLAIDNDNKGEFQKFSRVPIIDRTNEDPFTLSYPWIIKEKDGWKMWYGSNLTWSREKYSMSHVIKYAESKDGINWIRDGHIAINFKDEDEHAIVKPCVLFENGIYKMWYTYRGDYYRIGYAESLDGKKWQRLDDDAGILPASTGWDSEMLCYASVFKHLSDYYLLYCGNGYGKSGFGIAKMI